jgi:hypothetical protein
MVYTPFFPHIADYFRLSEVPDKAFDQFAGSNSNPKFASHEIAWKILKKKRDFWMKWSTDRHGISLTIDECNLIERANGILKKQFRACTTRSLHTQRSSHHLNFQYSFNSSSLKHLFYAFTIANER